MKNVIKLANYYRPEELKCQLKEFVDYYNMLKGLEGSISGDLLAQDIRQALHYLGEITGEITTDDLLGSIFSKFCIGK